MLVVLLFFVLSCSILPGPEGLCILWRVGTPFQSCEPVMLPTQAGTCLLELA